MNTVPDNQHSEIHKELYNIDPDLKQHEAVLLQLIGDVHSRRPTVGIDPAFVASLRTSLLEYKPAPQPNSTPTPSPLEWWATRLTPVGVALAIIIILLPDKTMAPIVPLHEQEANEMGMNAWDQSMQSDTGLFSTESAIDQAPGATLKATAPALVVEPPDQSSTITVASLTLSRPGWIVVYEDADGSIGAILHTSYLAADTFTDLSLSLNRPLTYPELVTVSVYTGNEPAAFSITNELVQIKPETGEPLMVTVPVVSKAELEGSH